MNWRKPLNSKNLGVNVNPRNGTLIWHQARYQFTPAATKNAPERNLKTSFQLTFIGEIGPLRRAQSTGGYELNNFKCIKPFKETEKLVTASFLQPVKGRR